ncbi:quinolinate synthase NadA [Tumebacillus sp. ITR2]|uniref:Quinolinate synthase n=1 Tax=Tumebacillus amylolyticus TaxID=2801339 RepID=A0ABS1J530_9BACL|nr:quinolinate synthase NadA [Tumebacillus amylolyticus]MBL0385382.1 quinolinate synthase NadA [Tumebacillus amylolyticus]
MAQLQAVPNREQNEYYVERLQQLKKERNAIILAHYYMRPEVQAVADYIGDSFGLSQKARDTDADVILFCGVHFMAESAKILNPDKIVLMPDERSGCPMADMVTGEGLRKLKAEHPNAKVVAYVNTSADVKAETDICCTSSNALKVIESVDTDEIIWVPDKNLGHYVSQFTDKKMIIWQGYCNTHDLLTPEEVLELKRQYPNAPIVVHPECRPEVVALGDYVGSTTGILKYCRESNFEDYIVATEEGVRYMLEKDSPEKTFHFASRFMVCPNMKVHNVKKMVRALETMQPQIHVDPEVAAKAKRSLDAMLAVVPEKA